MDEFVRKLIKQLDLEPLVAEGGMFRQTYVSADLLSQAALPERYRGDKPFSTAIYYLLSADPRTYSSLHRVPTDEVFHFYLGDPVEMLLLEPGGAAQCIRLGQDVLNGQKVQFVVPAGWWQGSQLLPGGRFALMGTTMAPGFTPEDFEAGDAESLAAAYPEAAELIRSLGNG